MRAVLFSFLSTGCLGCALLYDFTEGTGGGSSAANATATATGTQTTIDAQAASTTNDATSTSSGSFGCVLSGVIAPFADPEVVFSSASLAARDEGVLAFARTEGGRSELLAVTSSLLRAASAPAGEMSLVAAFGDARAILSGTATNQIDLCTIGGNAILCAPENTVGGTEDNVAIGSGEAAGEWILAMRKSGPSVIVTKQVADVPGSSSELTRFTPDAESFTADLSLFGANGNDGNPEGDALFVRYGEHVQRCLLGPDGCASTTYEATTAGLRQAVQRGDGAGLDVFFIDENRDVKLRVADEDAPFLDQSVGAMHLAYAAGPKRLYFDAELSGQTMIVSCDASGQQAQIASCWCTPAPAPATDIDRLAVSRDGTNLYFTTAGQLYRWSSSP